MTARIAAALTVLGLALTACTNPLSSKAEPSPSKPQETPASPSAPAALQLGTPGTAATPYVAASVTALTYRQPLPGRRLPRTGFEWAGAEVETCMKRSANPAATVAVQAWSLRLPDGSTVQPEEPPATDYEVTLYPVNPRKLPAGACVRGWAVFEVPGKVRASGVVYKARESDSPIAPITWAIGD
ncbi:hypothetical protein DZF91_16830 [Actinomadura logoneensis]|uniref:DUF4352 domain-containing protein n=1 Tax=Actinomadura logoneensis TaxID=2293572 RepID=A0A372JKW8_9ACTN|nr:hypothetical protein [Actinomadura logoneensis]RFU40484.1 hypothetical protein DZF91_16830 [Actinomadura logoneensis]